MIEPEWMREFELTSEQAYVALLKFKCYHANHNTKPSVVCTCVECVDKFICACSYDYWNTDGDCLYDK
jgi:hypothetical protein